MLKSTRPCPSPDNREARIAPPLQVHARLRL